MVVVVVVVVVVAVAAAEAAAEAVVVGAFPLVSDQGGVGGCTEVQRAWKARIFVGFGQASPGQHLGRRRVWRNSGGRFSARVGRWRLQNHGRRVLSRLWRLHPV